MPDAEVVRQLVRQQRHIENCRGGRMPSLLAAA
jgi:hypothetical protein